MSERLTSIVDADEITSDLSRSFDYQFNGTSEFIAPAQPDVPKEYGIGLIAVSYTHLTLPTKA